MLRTISRDMSRAPNIGGVSPYVYGGAGDGVTDDSAAVALAIATGRPVDLSGGTWAVKDLVVSSSTTCPGIFSDGSGTLTDAPSSTSSTIGFAITKDDFYVDRVFVDLPVSTDSGVAPAYDRMFYFANNSGASRHVVTNSRFVGGKYGPYFGGISYYVRAQGNVLTGIWGQAISIDAPNIAIITDNEMADGGYNSVASSGAIRCGSSGALAVATNVVISDNVITRWNEAFPQEGIDCTSAAWRNLEVCDNLISDCGNGGIEIKTNALTVSPNVHEQILVADNTIIMKTSGGVGVALNVTGSAPAAGKPTRTKVSGNLISCTSAPTTGTAVYGVTVQGYTDVMVSDNAMWKVVYGVSISGANVTGTTNTRTTISGNTIDAVDTAISSGSGTLDGMKILNNNLKSGLTCLALNTITITNADISYNRIESTASYGVELRDTSTSVVAYNEIIAALNGVLTQTTTCTTVRFSNNTVTTTGGSAGDAFNLGIGTALTVIDNQVYVPITKRVVIGAATYTAAGNVRGMVAADPSATIAGSLGDIFRNSAPSSGGVKDWVCTTAGNAGAAVYKGTAIP